MADGCKQCSHIGYKGRLGIYEMMTLNDELRELILSEASTGEIMNACRTMGMQTLRESGINKILSGITSIEEVLGETVAAEE